MATSLGPVVRADVLGFHVGPVFPADPKEPGHHLHLAGFAGSGPDPGRFAGHSTPSCPG
jgi:hypothetical protein